MLDIDKKLFDFILTVQVEMYNAMQSVAVSTEKMKKGSYFMQEE